MKTIWKFPLAITDQQDIAMPRGAELLCVQVQAGEPQLWAFVESDAEIVTRRLHIVGTGHPANHVEDLFYIGTFQYGSALVFHAFGGWQEASQ